MYAHNHRRAPSRTPTHTKERDVSRVDERFRVGRASGRVLCEALRELKTKKSQKSVPRYIYAIMSLHTSLGLGAGI